MNPKCIGDHIEAYIMELYQMEDSNIGFDGLYNNIEIEIKGCAVMHKNGAGSKGVQKITKGRFWIDNQAHNILLSEMGMYVFVLYKKYEGGITIERVRNMFAFEVDYWINRSDNTKLSYSKIFPDYKGGESI